MCPEDGGGGARCTSTDLLGRKDLVLVIGNSRYEFIKKDRDHHVEQRNWEGGREGDKDRDRETEAEAETERQRQRQRQRDGEKEGQKD